MVLARRDIEKEASEMAKGEERKHIQVAHFWSKRPANITISFRFEELWNQASIFIVFFANQDPRGEDANLSSAAVLLLLLLLLLVQDERKQIHSSETNLNPLENEMLTSAWLQLKNSNPSLLGTI
jgi:hypothetical protein